MSRVLVVDDNEQNLQILSALLRSHGHEVDTATNGVTALEQARQAPPDAVVSDILMPDMDGFMLCQHWKEDTLLSQRPFIFYTGTYTDERDRELAMRLGAEKFICKPTDPDDLVAAIHEVLAACENGTTAIHTPNSDEADLLRAHNQALNRKLRAKVIALETANQQLETQLGELKIAQTKLRVHDRALADMPTGVVILDSRQAGKPAIHCNRAFEAITGYSHGDVIGQPLRFLDDDQPPQPDLDQLRAAVERGETCSVVIRNLRRDGGFFWNDLTIAPVQDPEGRLTHLVGICVDITEHLRAREKLSNVESQLAHVSRLSTIGQMVAEIAHEVNQPLYAIQNYAKAAKNFLAEEDSVNWAALRVCHGEINDLATRGGRFIQRLRTFVSRTQTPRLPCDLKEIVTESVELLKFHTDRLGVSMRPKLTESPAPILCNRLEIQQVLVNLFQNACDSLEEKGDSYQREVEIRLVVDGRSAQIRVADNGTGFATDQENAFDSFVTTKENGMGLGLAISRTIIEGHGGKIEVESSMRGDGATILLTLPIYRERDNAE